MVARTATESMGCAAYASARPIPPALGKMLTQWIVDGQPPLDVSDISADRFGGS